MNLGESKDNNWIQFNLENYFEIFIFQIVARMIVTEEIPILSSYPPDLIYLIIL